RGRRGERVRGRTAAASASAAAALLTCAGHQYPRGSGSTGVLTSRHFLTKIVTESERGSPRGAQATASRAPDSGVRAGERGHEPVRGAAGAQQRGDRGQGAGDRPPVGAGRRQGGRAAARDER